MRWPIHTTLVISTTKFSIVIGSLCAYLSGVRFEFFVTGYISINAQIRLLIASHVGEFCYSFDYFLNCVPLGPITITSQMMTERRAPSKRIQEHNFFFEIYRSAV